MRCLPWIGSGWWGMLTVDTNGGFGAGIWARRSRRSPASRADVRLGSWPCKNILPKEVGKKPGPVRSQAAIAAISGLGPTMFMTRVRL